jgi:transposase InsO family protein
MPWKEATAVDERKAFLLAYERGEVSFSAICRAFNISRPTGYKWLDRFEREGEAGLSDQSRAPLHPARGTPRFVQDRILELRQTHPSWGPKKLLALLHQKELRVAWPAASTVGELLWREGLAHPRSPRRRTPAWSEPLAHAQNPNDVWCADFKGWFLCQNGERCDPLTITDAYSRYLFGCCSVPKTDGPSVRRVMKAAFRAYGLPLAIRTDNALNASGKLREGAERLCSTQQVKLFPLCIQLELARELEPEHADGNRIDRDGQTDALGGHRVRLGQPAPLLHFPTDQVPGLAAEGLELQHA